MYCVLSQGLLFSSQRTQRHSKKDDSPILPPLARCLPVQGAGTVHWDDDDGDVEDVHGSSLSFSPLVSVLCPAFCSVRKEFPVGSLHDKRPIEAPTYLDGNTISSVMISR